jgi:hypothetical protein
MQALTRKTLRKTMKSHYPPHSPLPTPHSPLPKSINCYTINQSLTPLWAEVLQIFMGVVLRKMVQGEALEYNRQR